MIKLENIHYQIGNKAILQQISLSVKPGVFTAILGPNGAGKSTLLKVMVGDISKHAGKVKINAKSRKAYSHQELAKIRAVLPQSVHIQFPYSVLEIVSLGCFAHKLKTRETTRLAYSMLEKVGMQGFSHRIYNSLSGGEKQRVQLARVMAQINYQDAATARYLLLDEPTASLDIACQHHILYQAKALCGENIGVLAVLHDLNLAAQYADHILLMKNGKEVAQGTMDEVYTQKNIENAYEHPVRLEYLPTNKQAYVIPLAPMTTHPQLKKI
ncbi:iron complex transport system ATP-binding protein [Catalinimonas alkaloidigena]|uniref:heme ABC transporter ATP-binding protein n=1 Tax=Catalinimonas alkaloidigena TaxID=1075417 RepID=UPI00240585BC|nr:heme ABC transporter ATP-binding protein [Catalinimonas alkaloidigena]MDF9796184.1 iron complex transport system ATP-binding protein [Catalinimonas alkaloidigena]